MNTSRAITGFLRKGLVQARGFTVPTAPLVSRRCQSVYDIIQSPHKWTASEKKHFFSRPHSIYLTPKPSLFSSVASPDLSQKEPNPVSSVEEGTATGKGEEIVEPVSQNQAKPTKTAQLKELDSESETSSDEEQDFSKEDLVRLVQEKDDLLKESLKEIKVMKEKVLRSNAEVENVMDRARWEAEITKKFAIQSFAESLLDVADNLSRTLSFFKESFSKLDASKDSSGALPLLDTLLKGGVAKTEKHLLHMFSSTHFAKSLLNVADNLSRASSVVKESFSKLDASKDSSGAAPLLKTLLEGVAMTEIQLLYVFKKHGVERFNPRDELFDPTHTAVFQIQDAINHPGRLPVVLKPGYTLQGRIIRRAEVGVMEAVESEGSSKVLLVNSDAEFSNALSKAQDNQGLAIAYFTATWFEPCRAIDPIVENLSTSYPNVTILKREIKLKILSNSLQIPGVTAVPTFHFYKNGAKVADLVGADPHRLNEIVRNLAK